MKQKQTRDITPLIIGIVVILFVLATSCHTSRYYYEGVNLKPGEISKYHERCTLTAVKVTKRGYKHIFIADNGDTLPRLLPKPLPVDSCYYVWKTKTDK